MTNSVIIKILKSYSVQKLLPFSSTALQMLPVTMTKSDPHHAPYTNTHKYMFTRKFFLPFSPPRSHFPPFFHTYRL